MHTDKRLVHEVTHMKDVKSKIGPYSMFAKIWIAIVYLKTFLYTSRSCVNKPCNKADITKM